MAATAIVVPLDSAESVIGSWRVRFTPDGRDDMPAHITLLYPWIDDRALETEHVHEVRDVLAGFSSFGVSLGRVASFPGTRTLLYLEPEPSAPFIEMTEALTAAFPGYPPYGGAFADVVPHATIVETNLDPSLETEVLSSVEPRLPVDVVIDRVWIMEHLEDRWRMRSEILLGVTDEV
ncbi:MAG: 2'-5' RNA ligase family protein [Actinomycetota bacterium]